MNNITSDNIQIKIINNIIRKQVSQYNFNILTINNITDLIESSLYLISEYFLKNSLNIMYPVFNNNITKYVYDTLEILTSHLQINLNIKDELNIIINISLSIFYKYVIPKRSYDKTFIRVQANIPHLKNKINYLQNIEQPEQRSAEWYEFRHNILTASNIYKVFGTNSVRNQLIYEKCKPININKYNNTPTNSPLHWGVKYEPLSVLYYEYIYNTKISDFGCIKHNKYDYIAASPDGINTLETSMLYGRMLEIKNIVNRIIDGNPKHEYWVQMQIQMETCNLNECDFLETRFVEYDTYENFINDGTFNLSADDKYKGMIMYFIKNNSPHYEYAPFNISKNKIEQWEESIMKKNYQLTWVKNIYWKLEEISCVLVLRNKNWFNCARPQIEELWDIIKIEREGNYEHRAPKKMQKTINKKKTNITVIKTDNSGLLSNICYIKTNNIKENKEADISADNLILNITTEVYNANNIDDMKD